ncbi:serine threonine kinase [Fusarium mundagurra]|uniref:Serine threonine kinase n=1 Tax=Fusarium mundagurra TaxID=1567541 RepID=A0A8H5YE54_9HYPO|nr:serine threonine kinase [Fusarium mundagurra]
MEEILANTHLPGYHEWCIVGETYKESSSIWDRAHVVAIDIPPVSEFGYEEGVEQLLDLARNVFLCQPTRLSLFGLFETGKQREFWLFDLSGIYRSGLFDHECNVQELLDVYGKMTEIELGINPFIKQEFGGPRYIYIKGDVSKMAPYDSDHSRGYKLVLDEEPLSYPGDIVSIFKRQSQDEEKFLRRTKERNVWGITHPIDYQFMHARNTSISCIVMPPFGRPITHYRIVLEVLECMRDTIKAHRSLYIDAKILHQDISLHSIFISNPKKNNPDASKGILIAFDTVMDVEIEPEKTYRGDRVLHTYRYDLESFLYVFLFIAIGGHRGLPDESRLKPWQAGFRNWPEIAEKKKKDISSNDNFAAIIAEFRQEFKGLESLAYALRDVLFFPDGNDFFTGMDMEVEATETLYGALIGAFEKAVVENRE